MRIFSSTYTIKAVKTITVAALLLFLVPAFTQRSYAADEFITTWQTNISDPFDASLSIPTYPTEDYDYTVDWGDGTITNGHTEDASHIYALPGAYVVKISGEFPRIYTNRHPDRLKLQTVESWGSNQWTSMAAAFQGAENLIINDTEAPNLSGLTSLSAMFSGAKKLNSPMNNWDVSRVTNFTYMFYDAESFNQNLDQWNVELSTSFLGMFQEAESFNGDIGPWDVGRSISFNSMFNGATNFNQPIGNWTVQNAQDTRFMFQKATNFNQDITAWRLPLVRTAINMFDGATSFNQNLSDWKMTSLLRGEFMFRNSGIGPGNYDNIVIGWSKETLRSGANIYNVTTTYCDSGPARDILIANRWGFSDLGLDQTICGPTDISFEQSSVAFIEGEAGSILGNITSTDTDGQQNHIYSFSCRGDYPDNSFFQIAGREVRTAVALSYGAPQDANEDNFYDICIVSYDEAAKSYIEKEFSVAINEQEDEAVITDGQVLGASTPTVSNNVTDIAEDDAQVLGADDTAGTLANTGSTIVVVTVTAGLLLTIGTIFIRTKPAYSLHKK